MKQQQPQQPQQAGKKQPPRPNAELGTNQGEGNVEASRHYNEQTRDFVKTGKVDEAAQRASPQSSKEAQDMRRAEQEGRSHAKGEDPQLHRKGDSGRDMPRE